MSKQMLEYGSWPSSLTAEQLTEGSVRYGHIQVDEGNFYWLESLPDEGGRQVIKCYSPNGETKVMTASNFNVRSRVHEYGGGDFCIHKGNIVFVNDADQRLYSQANSQPAVALTPEPEFTRSVRYADMQFHPNGRYLVAVKECHTADNNPHLVTNELVLINAETGDETALVSGCDFYSYPRFSPNGKQLTWLSWRHPDMPWDNTTLNIADITDQKLSNVKPLMDEVNESIYQPSWCPDGELHFVSDRSNWWNIYSLRDGVLNALTPMSVEFGFPQWQFGIHTYQFIDANRIAAVYTDNGKEQLCLIELDTGHIEPLELEFCHYERGIQCSDGAIFFIAASANLDTAVYTFDIENNELSLISDKQDTKKSLSSSEAETIKFPVGKQSAYAFFYAPTSSQYSAPEDSTPPLIVMIHGGPTGATHAAYNSGIQFWTSRGFAVVDVNYRGSTGFGRNYRDSLKYLWGIADVEDCIAVVKYLADIGRINPEAVAIRGGSAGGYTVYRALQESTVFKAGVSRYGVADLSSLTSDTHKFELHYLDRLIGSWPEDEAIYHERSPINNAKQQVAPMLLLQGDEDAVVPLSQSQAMAEALDEKEIPYHLEILSGEQHGFRQSHNIIKALELELNFYRQVFAIKADEKLAELVLKHAAKLH
ncbi:MAG: S9 family peptidase [Enterobacterales bacterium]|nr:S9 family peptidase [Enterobacterales bacterium]